MQTSRPCTLTCQVNGEILKLRMSTISQTSWIALLCVVFTIAFIEQGSFFVCPSKWSCFEIPGCMGASELAQTTPIPPCVPLEASCDVQSPANMKPHGLRPNILQVCFVPGPVMLAIARALKQLWRCNMRRDRASPGWRRWPSRPAKLQGFMPGGGCMA